MLLSHHIWGHHRWLHHDGMDLALVRHQIGAQCTLWSDRNSAEQSLKEFPLRDLQPAEPLPAHRFSLAVPLHENLSPLCLAIPNPATPGLLLLLQPAPHHPPHADPAHLDDHRRDDRHPHHLNHQLRGSEQLRSLSNHNPEHPRPHQDLVPR